MANSLFSEKQTQVQSRTQRDVLISFALFLLVLISRIPFRSKVLYHWDSVNFAYSLREFDIAKDQPQPPGYILYVLLCKGINYFVNNPQATMVLLGIVSSGLAVIALYFLGKEMFNWQTGLAAGLFLGVSPLFWFYGEIALPHTLDTFFVVFSVFLLYKVYVGETKYRFLAVISLAIAGGFRPQTLVFLLPLTIYAFRKIGLKQLLGLGLLGAFICLLWFIPLVNSAGGIANYFTVMGRYSDRFQSTTSIFKGAGFFGIKRNFTKLALYTIYGLAASLFGVIFIPALLKKRMSSQWKLYGFLCCWFFPSLLYYLLIHMGQQGLIFTYLPALFLFLAFLIVNALGQQKLRLISMVLIICVLNAGVFLFVPEYPLPIDQRFLTRDTLKNSDDYFQNRFDAIRLNFQPESALIFASNWHHVEYYLPEFKVARFEIGSKWEVNEGDINSGNTFIVAAGEGSEGGKMDVIVFDSELNQINLSLDQLRQIPISANTNLQYFELKSGEFLEVGEYSIRLVRK